MGERKSEILKREQRAAERAARRGEVVAEGPVRRVKGSVRRTRLPNGAVVVVPVVEHLRHVGGSGNRHRLSEEMTFPQWQRERLDMERAETERSVGYDRESTYISPEDVAATAYMERQRRLLHLHRRGGL